MTAHRQHQRHGQLDGGQRVRFGRIHHQHAAQRRRIDIDIV
jgi:hypothetical protein